MISGITYSDDNMVVSRDKCALSMRNYGVGNVHAIGRSDIPISFYLTNKDILDAERGGGYWLWKAYFIYDVIRTLTDNSILIYSDAGVEFVNSVHHIIDRMDEDILFFTNGFPHVEWCKWDCIDSINGWNSWHRPMKGMDDVHGIYIPNYGDIKDYTQVQASVIFFRVNQTTRNFVKEWLLWCQMPGFIDDSPSKMPNYPTFAEHRHDQAILTCLQIKYGYKLHFWPTMYSEHIRHTAQPGDDYPTLFSHHRKRNHEWG